MAKTKLVFFALLTFLIWWCRKNDEALIIAGLIIAASLDEAASLLQSDQSLSVSRSVRSVLSSKMSLDHSNGVRHSGEDHDFHHYSDMEEENENEKNNDSCHSGNCVVSKFRYKFPTNKKKIKILTSERPWLWDFFSVDRIRWIVFWGCCNFKRNSNDVTNRSLFDTVRLS